MLSMPSTDAARLLLFADEARTAAPSAAATIRRYRLGRLLPAAAKPAGVEPRYAYLKRSYD